MPRYAALDIGSNSIRMMAAEATAQEPLKILAAEREVVRLGTGVFRDGKLRKASIELACGALSRMAAIYRKLDVLAVRAVGTSALRDASNQGEFLDLAAEILGTPVEVISGLEEARLIHLGVQTRWPHPKHRLLILDVGGGSAELILSEAGHVVDAFSKPLGAVRLTEMFLKSDPADERELARMSKYIQERLEGPAARFNSKPIGRMIATSATAAAAVCAANHVRRARRDKADRLPASAPQIRQLFRDVSSKGLNGRSKITGIGPRRAEIITAGVAVLNEAMQELRVPRLYYSAAGVRDGIIADLVHRRAGMEQARLDSEARQTVRALGRRYEASVAHTRKVADLSAMLFEGLRDLHRLPLARGRLLEAAAYLFNIGHYVNEAKHHRHSMYLVANSDLPGFSDTERSMIANLCRYHRKSMPQPSHELFVGLNAEDRRAILLMAPLLRLAVALDQSQEQRVERVEAVIHPDTVELRLYSKGDVDIEQWHAAQVADVFREVYGHALVVRTKR